MIDLNTARASRQPGGPETRERARRIGSSFTHETPSTLCPHCGSVLFVRGGKCEACSRKVTSPPLQRIIFDQWPLKRLHARHVVTSIQFEAGYRYYQHWYASGLSPLAGVDFGSIRGSSEPNVGMASSERQAHHRGLYRIGESALGKGISTYVDAIVLQQQEPEVVGVRISGRTSINQARAVAIECVKIGLDRLAEAYDLKARRG